MALQLCCGGLLFFLHRDEDRDAVLNRVQDALQQGTTAYVTLATGDRLLLNCPRLEYLLVFEAGVPDQRNPLPISPPSPAEFDSMFTSMFTVIDTQPTPQ
jgi:hypothetical protein